MSPSRLHDSSQWSRGAGFHRGWLIYLRCRIVPASIGSDTCRADSVLAVDKSAGRTAGFGTIPGCTCSSPSSTRSGPQRPPSVERRRAAPGTPLGGVPSGIARAPSAGAPASCTPATSCCSTTKPARRAAAARRRGADRRPARRCASPAGCSSCTCWPGRTPATCTTWRRASTASGGRWRPRVRVDDPDVSRLHAVLRVATDELGRHHRARPRLHQRHHRRRRGGRRGTVGGCCRARCSGSATPGCPWCARSRCRCPAGRTAPGTWRSTGRPATVARPAPVRVTVPPEPPARERSRFPLVADPAPAGRGRRPRGGHAQPDVPGVRPALAADGARDVLERPGGRPALAAGPATRARRAERPGGRGDRPGRRGRGGRAGAERTPGRRRSCSPPPGPRPRLWERRRG